MRHISQYFAKSRHQSGRRAGAGSVRMRRRPARVAGARGRAAGEYDDALVDITDPPWSNHIGPYPVSCYMLDNPGAHGDEHMREIARVECEHEFRLFDGNLQAPTIRQFLRFGVASAFVRLIAPMLKRYVTVEDDTVSVTLTYASLSRTCQVTHVLEGSALMAVCAYCAFRGFKENPRTLKTTPPSTFWWQMLFVSLYFGALVRHANDCVLTHSGGVIAEQFIAFFVVNLIIAGWRPPLVEVIHSRVAGWAMYSTAMHCFKTVFWYSHAIRFVCGVVVPILLTGALEIRSRKIFANEIAMNVGAGVWGLRNGSGNLNGRRERRSGSADQRSQGIDRSGRSPSLSPWQSPTPSPQYEFR